MKMGSSFRVQRGKKIVKETGRAVDPRSSSISNRGVIPKRAWRATVTITIHFPKSLTTVQRSSIILWYPLYRSCFFRSFSRSHLSILLPGHGKIMGVSALAAKKKVGKQATLGYSLLFVKYCATIPVSHSESDLLGNSFQRRQAINHLRKTRVAMTIRMWKWTRIGNRTTALSVLKGGN